jgi:hypothetical protein
VVRREDCNTNEGTEDKRRDMNVTIKVEVNIPITSEVVHRFRNFGEDVYRHLRNTCSISIEEIDSSTNSLFIREIRRRDVSTVTQVIKRELKRHGFEDSGSVTRLDPK